MGAFYDMHYARDLAQLSAKPKVVNSLLASLEPLGRVLDIGCGDGGLTIEYAKHCSEVLGVELASEACRLAHASGLNVIRANLEGLHLPLADASFDVVVAGEIIEHMTDTDHLLDEITRVLKPGGYCIITTPNLGSWYNRLLLVAGYQPYHTDVSLHHQVGKLKNVATGGSGHFNVFTLRALRELVQLHGLVPVDVRGSLAEVDFPLLFRVADRAMSTFPDLASYVILLSRKSEPTFRGWVP